MKGFLVSHEFKYNKLVVLAPQASINDLDSVPVFIDKGNNAIVTSSLNNSEDLIDLCIQFLNSLF